MLLHCFEQRRLGFRRCAVDFVRENDVGENRAANKDKRAFPGLIRFLENVRAGNVRGHQVRRKLDAIELQRHDLRQRIDDHRLRQSRHAHEQAVASGKNTNQQSFDDLFLADDDFAHLGANLAVKLPQFINGAHIALGLPGILDHNFFSLPHRSGHV